MGEDLLDYLGVFYGGNDPHGSIARPAGLDVDAVGGFPMAVALPRISPGSHRRMSANPTSAGS